MDPESDKLHLDNETTHIGNHSPKLEEAPQCAGSAYQYRQLRNTDTLASLVDVSFLHLLVIIGRSGHFDLIKHVIPNK